MAQGLFRYRCFLPDLTEFTVPPCTGPNYQQSTSTSQRIENRDSMIAIFHPPSRYDSTGGEGGIRTPGTRIRGTHDFQSCTFNRSVTSPARKFTGLRVLPCSLERRCLQNVSARDFFVVLAPYSPTSTTYHRKFSGAKTKRRIDERCTVESRAAGFKYAEERHFLCMSPECLHVASALSEAA